MNLKKYLRPESSVTWGVTDFMADRVHKLAFNEAFVRRDSPNCEWQ